MLLVCNKCGATKPQTEFYAVTQRGVTQLRRICKECSKAQLRDHSNDSKPAGRICTKCGIYKPLSEFHKHKICQYGVEPMCKACRLRKRRQYTRDYPERIRNTDLQLRYGMTLAEYNAMHARQEGKCAICGTAEAKLVVDHNHVNGQVRKLLCTLCNTMIGYAREDISVLLSAAGYLLTEEHGEQIGGIEHLFASLRRHAHLLERSADANQPNGGT